MWTHVTIITIILIISIHRDNDFPGFYTPGFSTRTPPPLPPPDPWHGLLYDVAEAQVWTTSSKAGEWEWEGTQHLSPNMAVCFPHSYPERQLSLFWCSRVINLKKLQALVTKLWFRIWAKQSDRWSFLTQETDSLSLSFFCITDLTGPLLSIPFILQCRRKCTVATFKDCNHSNWTLTTFYHFLCLFFRGGHHTLLGNHLIVYASAPTTR